MNRLLPLFGLWLWLAAGPGVARSLAQPAESAARSDVSNTEDQTVNELTLVLAAGLAWNFGDEESAGGPAYEIGLRLQHGLFLFQVDCGQSTSRVGTANTGVRSWRTVCGPKLGVSMHEHDWDVSAMFGVDGVLGHHVVDYRGTSEVLTTLRVTANAQFFASYRHGFYRIGPILRFRFGEHYRELQVLIHIGYAFSL